MNIVFLDIHGVLETIHSPTHRDLHPDCVQRLHQLLRAFDLRIVLTSNERIGRTPKELTAQFQRYQLPIFDVTPHIPYSSRGDEIREWLTVAPYRHHEPVRNFVIMDDDNDMGSLTPHLARTCYQDGISEQTLQDAFCILQSGGTYSDDILSHLLSQHHDYR